jgi:anthranilate/para-aminobenzoate synthase component I
VLLTAARPAWRVRTVVRRGAVPGPESVWPLLPAPWRFWLEGAADGVTLSWGGPLWCFRGRAGRGVVSEAGRDPRRFGFTDPTDVLREALRGTGDPRREPGVAGAVGYWGYESARYFDRVAVSDAPPTGPAADDFVWSVPRFWARWRPDGALELSEASREGGADASESLEAWSRRFAAIPPAPVVEPAVAAVVPPDVEKRMRAGRTRYLAGVRAVRRYIAAGDVYQANLTHRTDLPWPAGASATDFFFRLRRLNPSPHAVLLDYPGFSVASCSPELLLRARGDRVETRPIAGTRPRGDTADEDRRLGGELLLNEKERAEHVMLVDLERNDLGRVCRPGSVRVSERMSLERYSHVIHIVSHVEGRLAPGRDALDAARALFPGGTITGCPKIRCLQILSGLEGEPRGPFFGSAGRLGFDGGADLNILIRTAVIGGGTLSFRVGAGIVADSDPAREFEETLHKARALAAAYGRVRRAAP